MNLKEYLVEKLEKDTEEAKKKAEDAVKESSKDESITDEKSFRAAAKAKFEKVFGDDLDEQKMKDIVDGILDKYKKEAEAGDWGTLIGVLNKSFGK